MSLFGWWGAQFLPSEGLEAGSSWRRADAVAGYGSGRALGRKTGAYRASFSLWQSEEASCTLQKLEARACSTRFAPLALEARSDRAATFLQAAQLHLATTPPGKSLLPTEDNGAGANRWAGLDQLPPCALWPLLPSQPHRLGVLGSPWSAPGACGGQTGKLCTPACTGSCLQHLRASLPCSCVQWGSQAHTGPHAEGLAQ